MLSTIYTSLSLGGAVLIGYWILIQVSLYLNPLRKLPYPPSPPPRNFILGHARDLLSKPLWLKLMDLGARYGSIMHLKVLDKHSIVLSSVDDAIALLEKRPTQVEKVNDMLYSLLRTPEDFSFMTHIKTLAVSIIMATMYGYQVSPKDDPFQKIAEDSGEGISECANPDASIVNVLPFLRFLPAWFPGADFHRLAEEVREKAVRLQEVPYQYVRDNLATGTASPSFVAGLLETCKSEEDHLILKEVAATGYGAGADTTTSAVGTFFRAMAMFPHVQKKAQEELDRVVGSDRFANYDDEQSLPYIQAIYREVLRWRPPVPLGVPHATSAEDVYDGYYIPKGATIITNMWAMSRDPAKYKDPERFNPDRFFDENNELNSDDVGYIFGFGRRICPGRHMAAATLWLTIAAVLSTFDIQPPKDDSGNDIPVDAKHSDGLVSFPLPFKCTIAPRSIQAKGLILDIRNNSL